MLPARQRTCQPNAPAFDAREGLHGILGVDLTSISLGRGTTPAERNKHLRAGATIDTLKQMGLPIQPTPSG
ncbi:MAG TPA: hypothetical protein VGM32_11195 [Rhodopila sp.]